MEFTIFPVFYFPPIEYFLSLKKFDDVILEKQESYTKQTYRNRCYILGPNGKQALTVPIKSGPNKKIDVINVSYDNKWVLEHIRSIETAYNNAPYFIFYWDKYKKILLNKPEKLFDLNLKIFQEILKDLNLNIKFSFSIEYHREARHDFRNSFNAKQMNGSKIAGYTQVFSDRFGFISNLSILDLLFNLGPEASIYIKNFK